MRLLTAVLTATFALQANAPVQLLPHGEFAARDGRPGPGKKWKLDDTRGQALAARMNDEVAQTDFLFDYDHATLSVDKHGRRAPAAGWAKGVKWHDGQGLFAEPVTWTPAAAQHIKDGEYRYVSPVLAYDRDSGEVVHVFMASLVNYPALAGMEPVVARLAAQFSPPDDPEPTTMNETLKALLQALGLADTATKDEALSAVATLKKPAALPAALSTALGLEAAADEKAALAAVTALRAASKPDAELVTKVATLSTELETLRAKLVDDELAAEVDDAIKAFKVVPASRQSMIELGRQNRTALSAYLKSALPIEALAGQSRKGAHDPAGEAGAGDAPEIASLATQYQAEQAKAGITVSTRLAVDHVMAKRAAGAKA
jgi:phage I-like protein